jgi:nucleoside-diphosphate-sugar epimerase
MKILLTGGSGFIGTNLVNLLIENKIQNILNVDIQKPYNLNHTKYWMQCDILNFDSLHSVFIQFKPTHVIHLAARTDTSSDILDDYKVNTLGTLNLLKIVEKCECVKHLIITSTQYVYKNEFLPIPNSDYDYNHHTIYGLSKKISEQYTRESNLNCTWTIIRPTNVWGPWNMRYPNELWRILDLGLYFHPKNANPIKSYAYVKNVVYQIYKIIELSNAKVSNKVFYVGDKPIRSTEWINQFSLILTGKHITYIPRIFLYVIAFFGTILNKIGLKFPLNLTRYNNMIDDYSTPMENTIELLGLSHPNLETNIKETVNWFKNEGNIYFPYWEKKQKN